MKFPPHFLFGSATSAHQIEGGNINSDWYQFELTSGKIKDGSTSIKAADSWHKYKDDIELLKSTNQNAYRFSIEWSKIEPREGQFDQSAISHYKNQLKLLKQNNISIMVTIWHFTSPLWFAKLGGFTKKRNTKYFVRYALKITEEFSEFVDLWATLNEPNVYILKGYILGDWYPGIKNYWQAVKVWKNLNYAHNQTYRTIKKNNPKIQMGIVISTMAFVPIKSSLLNNFVVWLARLWSYELMFRFVIKNTDFIGLNYYIKTTLQAKRPIIVPEKGLSNDYGWFIHPEGIYQTIKENSKWNKPIYITENGLADSNDKFRPQFLRDTFSYLEKAISENLSLKGYFHWSLLDNFEWASGYTMKFGLHTIDRKPRPSAKVYSELIKRYQQ